MSQKIFLTSALAMGVFAPAFAEPSHTGTFPSDGYMEEDYTYTNAATSDNMDGVYSGTVNAVAEYDIIDYIVNAGQYLPADSETVITCPAGSYCPGISGNVQYNQSTPQGIQTCPTGYASSAAGASSDTQCYRQCSGNVTIEHATGVTGNDYYGNGADTCEPTDCVNGWHIKQGFTGDLTLIIGNSNAMNSAIVNTEGLFIENDLGSGPHDITYYGLNTSNRNSFAADYVNKGVLRGHAVCSTTPGTANWNGANSTFSTESSITDQTGQDGAIYCWCKLDGYIPSGENLQNLSSSWVFYNAYSDSWQSAVANCSGCARECSTRLRGYSPENIAFRTALFNAITPTLASCEANTITINWNDVDPEYAGQNNEGTATYGSDVRTPVKAATKKGQTFRGWRFSKPTETNLP